MENKEMMGVIGKKTRTIFIVIDNAGRMYGRDIAAVNRAMEEIVVRLQAIQEECINSEQINIAVLTVGNKYYRWINENPVPVSDFFWEGISASGISDWKDALIELDSKLRRRSFLFSENGILDPIIIFIAKGEPADDWKAGLSILNENKWYTNRAIKAGVAIEDGAVERTAEMLGPRGQVFVASSSDKIECALQDCLSFIRSYPNADPVAEENEVTDVYPMPEDENAWNIE